MKLIPKAKPVRIRIMSGGEEHSSLDSLKHNFNVDDIRPLLDHRLSRWLRQQHENELAKNVDEFDASHLEKDERYWLFLNIFFQKEFEKEGITDLKSLGDHWMVTPEYKKNYNYLSERLAKTNIIIAKDLYYHPEKNTEKIDLLQIFLDYINNQHNDDDAEVLFIAGSLMRLKKDKEHQKKGFSLIKKAASLKFKDAVEYIAHKRFGNVVIHEMKTQIQKIWDTKCLPCPMTMYTLEEKEILEFAFQCRTILNFSFFYQGSLVHKYVYNRFGITRVGEPLEFEKKFISAMMYREESFYQRGYEILQSIRDKYPPAAAVLDKNKVLGQNIYSMNLGEKIKFVVFHLFDFNFKS